MAWHPDVSIAGRICASAPRSPDKPALVAAEGRVSYGSLRAAARCIAADLEPGTRVALLLPSGVPLVEAFLGAVMAGTAAAVLDPRWTDDELAAAIADVEPAVVITDAVQRSRLKGADVAKALLVAASGSGIPPVDTGFEPPHVASEAPFYIGFTSGTSGTPKGYLRSHRSWLASLDAAACEFPVAGDDRVLIPGSLTQSMFLYGLVETLSVGATACLLARFDAGEALAVVARERVTRLHAVPTMLARLADAAEGLDGAVSGVRTVLSAGEKLPADLRDRTQRLFPSAAIFEYYGASELSFVSVAPTAEGWPAKSVGRPFHGVTVEVRDDAGRPLPTGDIGRLWVRSDMLCSGYLRDDEDQGFRVVDGWATVGDFAYLDRAGAVNLAGRDGGMVVIGGRNVYPGEVEAVLRALPEVAEAVVLGLPDPVRGHDLCAVLRWRNGATLRAAELAAHCRRRLSGHKCPRRWFAVPQFPVSSHGKIALDRLRDALPQLATIA